MVVVILYGGGHISNETQNVVGSLHGSLLSSQEALLWLSSQSLICRLYPVCSYLHILLLLVLAKD